MKLSDEQIEKIKKMDGIGDFINTFVDVLSEIEGDGPAKIMKVRRDLGKKADEIMENMTENFDSFKDKEKCRRYINFFEELGKLIDEFKKAEGI